MEREKTDPTPAVEFLIASLCNDTVGGELHGDSEFDFSITPEDPVEDWIRDAENEKKGKGKGPHPADTRTFRVHMPSGTPGEIGIAKRLQKCLSKALEGTGVTVSAFGGGILPGGGRSGGDSVAKLVFEGVRAVDVVWTDTKIKGWLWGRHGRTGQGMFTYAYAPGAPLTLPAWPSFPPGWTPPGRGRYEPGYPWHKGKLKTRPGLQRPASPGRPVRRRLEGGGRDQIPGGSWRRLAIYCHSSPFGVVHGIRPTAYEGVGGWHGREVLLPTGCTPQEEAESLMTAWRALVGDWPELWPLGVDEVCLEPEGTGDHECRGVHWELDVSVMAIRPLLSGGLCESMGRTEAIPDREHRGVEETELRIAPRAEWSRVANGAPIP